MAVPTKINIQRKRGDTRRMIFKIKSSTDGSGIDISLWTAFLLTVDPSFNPVDDTGNAMQINGVIVDGPGGRVAFTPTGTTAIGNYFYDAQAVDENTEKVTFAEGTYELIEDITKD